MSRQGFFATQSQNTANNEYEPENERGQDLQP